MTTTQMAAMLEAGITVPGQGQVRVTEWVKRSMVDPARRNPRQGQYRCLEELVANVRANGILVPLEVWRTPQGRLELLSGHRRLAAAEANGMEEVPVVLIAEITDETEAFGYLLDVQCHTDPFSSWEMCVAAQEGVKLGMDVEALSGRLARSESRVQLLLFAARDLPAAGQRAVERGDLSLEHVALLQKVSPGDRGKCVQQLLDIDVSAKQAKNYVQDHFIRPRKQQEEWLGLLPKLKREVLPMVDGFCYVEWGDRDQYVAADNGHPEEGYQRADGWVPAGDLVAGAKPVQWGTLAVELGAPRYVVPAPEHKERYVVLVPLAVLREAECVRATSQAAAGPGEPGYDVVLKWVARKVGSRMTNDECGMTKGPGQEGAETRTVGEIATATDGGKVLLAMTTGEEDRWEEGDQGAATEPGEAGATERNPLPGCAVKLLLGVQAALRSDPTKAMTKEVGEPLLRTLVAVACGEAREAMEVLTGVQLDPAQADDLPEMTDRAMEVILEDKKTRASLRWMLLCLLAMEVKRSVDWAAWSEGVCEVADALGVEMAPDPVG